MSLRDQVKQHVQEAQESIRLTLQKLNEDTGLIPESLTFDAIDVSTIEDHGIRRVIMISNVYVRANT